MAIHLAFGEEEFLVIARSGHGLVAAAKRLLPFFERSFGFLIPIFQPWFIRWRSDGVDTARGSGDQRRPMP